MLSAPHGPVIDSLGRRARRLLGVLRRAPSRLGGRCSLVGQELRVERGVEHPLRDGGPAFYYRTVGPMIAPGQRVLVLRCGAGLGALVAASRGARVTATDPDLRARRCTQANALAAGLEVEVLERPPPGPYDLVLDPAGDAGGELGPWIGERGRLLRLRSPGRSLPPIPSGFQAVRLATSPGVFAPFEVQSVGWDLAAARAARHRERGSDDAERRASVSRRRWQGDPQGPAPAEGPGPSEDPAPAEGPAPSEERLRP